MLGLFRTNQFLANILLIFYVALLRGGLFITTTPTLPTPQGIWSFELYRSLANDLWLLPHIAAGLIFFQAVGLNFIATRFRFSEEITLFTGVLYILLVSSVLELGMPTPTLIANTFLIIILFSLFETYRKSTSAAAIFNIGLWVAIGSFFHFAFAIFLFFGIIGLNVLRAYNFKEILMLLIGAFTAYFLVGSVYFLYDSFDVFWNEQITKNLVFFNIVSPNTWITYAERIFFGLLILIVIVSQGVYSFKKNIQIQKYQTVLYWAMLISGLTILYQSNVGMEQLAFVMPTLSFFLMYNFTKFEKAQAEALHIIWLLIIFALQFHQTLGF